MGNSASTNNADVEKNNNIEKNSVTMNNESWRNAVNGNTETLSYAPNVNHAAFETTSEEEVTESEHLGAMPLATKQFAEMPLNSKKLQGGDILSYLSSLLQETEVEPNNLNGGLIESKLNEIRSLLEDTETNNLVGGEHKLRDLLLHETETFINLRGGALQNENLFSNLKKEHSEHKKEHSEHKKEHSEHKKTEVIPEEVEEVEEEKEEEEEKEDVPEKVAEEEENTDQSGGEELDTELKGILKELQTNSKNYKGGKSSRKSSKKSKASKASKKQSRRSATEESNMSNGTYDIDTEGGSDDEDYLTSTSSMRTSDINIKHYRS
jgi:hypothetical protein